MILSFRSPPKFRKWLAANHDKSDGIWLRIFKKNSETASVTYAEALDEALCFGWIDGQKQKHDDQSWLQKFTRRRAKSGWSRINTGHAERLIKAGRMKAPGQAEVNAAKKDGRWKAAYDSPSNASFPDDFLAAHTTYANGFPPAKCPYDRSVLALGSHEATVLIAFAHTFSP